MTIRGGQPARRRKSLNPASRTRLREGQMMEIALSQNASWQVGAHTAPALQRLPWGVRAALEARRQAEASLRREAERQQRER